MIYLLLFILSSPVPIHLLRMPSSLSGSRWELKMFIMSNLFIHLFIFKCPEQYSDETFT